LRLYHHFHSYWFFDLKYDTSILNATARQNVNSCR
jgi:hypothetical protein